MAYAALLLLGVIGFNYSTRPKRIERELCRLVARELPDAQEIRVDVRGPTGLRALKGKLHAVDLYVRGFRTDHFPLAASVTRPAAKTPGEAGQERVRGPCGRIDHLTIRADNFAIAGIAFDHLSATIEGLHFDLNAAKQQGRFDLVCLRSGTAEFETSAAAIARLASERLESVQDPRIEILDGQVHLVGKQRFLMLPVTLDTIGKLSVGPDNALIYTAESVRVNGVALPKPAAKGLLEQWNPVLVLDPDMWPPLRLELQSVECLPGVVRWRVGLSVPQAAL